MFANKREYMSHSWDPFTPLKIIENLKSFHLCIFYLLISTLLDITTEIFVEYVLILESEKGK